MQDNHRDVVVGFYEAEQEQQNGILNALINWWTRTPNAGVKSFSHVELRFSNGMVTSVSNKEGKVYCVDGKLMSNEHYSAFYKIDVSQEQEEMMLQMVNDYVERDVSFNFRGMFFNFVPLLSCLYSDGTDGDGKQVSVFCSQYITQLFQHVGIFYDLDAPRTTPNDLYESVRAHGTVVKNMALRKALGTEHLDNTNFIMRRRHQFI